MIHKYDTHFYVGTVHQHPGTWIIVGLFYSPFPPRLKTSFPYNLSAWERIMDSNELTKKTLEVLGAGPLAHEMYKDLLQPAAREVGTNLLTVAKTVTIAMMPLTGAVWGAEQIRDWLAVKLTQKLSKTSATSIWKPKMNIAGPALLNLRFSEDENELREMYANLLASSMCRESADFVHPAFPSIVQQMTSDEARIMRHIYCSFDSPQICYSIFHATKQERVDGEEPEKSLEQLAKDAKLERVENIHAYVDNLERLKLFEAREHADLGSGEETYAVQKGSYGTISMLSTYELLVPYFGDHFINACVRGPNEPVWGPFG